jgi:hypothetical protein
MKKGTKITAARAGVVIRVKEDGKRGGIRKNSEKKVIISSFNMTMAVVPVIGICSTKAY